MKKRDIFEGIIEGMDFPDKGWLYMEDRKVTVKYALPGQKVRFRIVKMKKGKAEATLLEVLEPSALENRAEACPHAGICGGCLYQTLPYEEQLRIKEEQVRSLLRPAMEKYGETSFEDAAVFEGIAPSPLFRAYRNKMEFSFGDMMKDGPLALGMHRRGSFYDIVTVTDCKIVHEDFRKVLQVTLDFFVREGLPFYRKMQHTGYLRHLLVRKAVKTGQILICLVTSSQYVWDDKGEAGDRASEDVRKAEDVQGVGEVCFSEDIQKIENAGEATPVLETETGVDVGKGARTEKQMLSDFVKVLLAAGCQGTVAGVLHIVNDSLADVVQSDRTDILYGQDYFYEELLGLRFKITPFSFFQTNSLGAEVLYGTVREYVGMFSGQKRDGADTGAGYVENGAPVVFDLYSGTGTIAQLIAPAAGQVIGVEIVEEAVRAARENAALNGLENCKFIAADVLKALDEMPQKPDFIVLDPPREGVHPKALGKIVDYSVERMIYISCKPTSLARDLDVLMAAGYRVEKWRMVDMFPGTGNVECVVLLSKVQN